jgi:hypothetical protein
MGQSAVAHRQTLHAQGFFTRAALHRSFFKMSISNAKPVRRGKAQAKKWYPEPGQVRGRVKELNRFFTSLFPDQEMPNNSLGRKWARVMMQTKRLYPSPNNHLWLKSWCPWMPEEERSRMLRLKGYWHNGEELGQRFEVGNEMRNEIGFWSVRPNDVEWADVQAQKRQRDYIEKQAKRHANGVELRRKGAAEPWKALRMSKATYYRKKLHLTAHPVGGADSQVSGETPESATDGILRKRCRRQFRAMPLARMRLRNRSGGYEHA